MTTGRINQVTILNQRHRRRDDPPKGTGVSVTIWQDTPKRARPQAPNPQMRADDRRPIQLPPLSFPKYGPSRERSGFHAAKLRHLRTSSGGDPQPIMPG